MTEQDEHLPEVVELHSGQAVWYCRPGESVCRPARLLSDGISESVRTATGVKQYAHLEYATADDTHVFLGHDSPKPAPGDPDDKARAVSQRQTHETSAPWDPTGAPGTWHLDGEAEHLKHPDVKGSGSGRVQGGEATWRGRNTPGGFQAP